MYNASCTMSRRGDTVQYAQGCSGSPCEAMIRYTAQGMCPPYGVVGSWLAGLRVLLVLACCSCVSSLELQTGMLGLGLCVVAGASVSLVMSVVGCDWVLGVEEGGGVRDDTP
jgi:hypothetical protein